MPASKLNVVRQVEITTTERELSAGFYVVNERGVTVRSFADPGEAWAFITPDEVKRRGPMHVVYRRVVEQERRVSRFRMVRP